MQTLFEAETDMFLQWHFRSLEEAPRLRSGEHQQTHNVKSKRTEE